jgi:hypothetical protein
VSDRTAQEFEKLKAHNKELAEKLALMEQNNQPKPQFSSVLDELNPSLPLPENLSQDQVNKIAQSLEDKDGYIDTDLLNETIQEASSKARKAEERAQRAEDRVAKFEETQIVKTVHEAFPQLDPYNQAQFDSRFYEMVKNEMIGQLMQGKQDYMAAAKKVNSLLAQSETKQQEQVAQVEEKQKVISQREQATASTPVAKAVPQQGSYEDQVAGTRKGDALSIGQRLQSSGY